MCAAVILLRCNRPEYGRVPGHVNPRPSCPAGCLWLGSQPVREKECWRAGHRARPEGPALAALQRNRGTASGSRDTQAPKSSAAPVCRALQRTPSRSLDPGEMGLDKIAHSRLNACPQIWIRGTSIVRRIVGLCCLLALAGCANSDKMTVQSVTAKDVPIHFAYGGIKDADAQYSGAESSWSGMTVRRAQFRGGGEYALFEVVRFAGNYGTVHRSVSSSVGQLINKELLWLQSKAA